MPPGGGTSLLSPTAHSGFLPGLPSLPTNRAGRRGQGSPSSHTSFLLCHQGARGFAPPLHSRQSSQLARGPAPPARAGGSGLHLSFSQERDLHSRISGGGGGGGGGGGSLPDLQFKFRGLEGLLRGPLRPSHGCQGSGLPLMSGECLFRGIWGGQGRPLLPSPTHTRRHSRSPRAVR